MTWLLDGNVLVALAIDTHEFHDRARQWFDAEPGPFATCAVTEGTMLRLYLRLAANREPAAAWDASVSSKPMCSSSLTWPRESSPDR